MRQPWLDYCDRMLILNFMLSDSVTSLPANSSGDCSMKVLRDFNDSSGIVVSDEGNEFYK